ncbi:MAG: hypothetical protein K5668_08425 [Lachnospiraceae bacterium]|nr:hypothetical protein [Lachnospiraceae bacterium]
MTKLHDDELENVAGGFKETNQELRGYTYGLEIVCPSCGESSKNGFFEKVFVDTKMKTVEYHCNCQAKFVVYRKNVIMKDEWIKKCQEKNYVYPYQG